MSEKDPNSWKGWGGEIKTAIYCGDFDDVLLELKTAIESRSNVLSLSKSRKLKVKVPPKPPIIIRIPKGLKRDA